MGGTERSFRPCLPSDQCPLSLVFTIALHLPFNLAPSKDLVCSPIAVYSGSAVQRPDEHVHMEDESNATEMGDCNSKLTTQGPNETAARRHTTHFDGPLARRVPGTAIDPALWVVVRDDVGLPRVSQERISKSSLQMREPISKAAKLQSFPTRDLRSWRSTESEAMS
jgi:hypothetical protein